MNLLLGACSESEQGLSEVEKSSSVIHPGAGPCPQSPLCTCLGSSSSRLQVVTGTDSSGGSHAHLWNYWEKDGANIKTPEESLRPPSFSVAFCLCCCFSKRLTAPCLSEVTFSFAHTHLFRPSLPSSHCPHSHLRLGELGDS